MTRHIIHSQLCVDFYPGRTSKFGLVLSGAQTAVLQVLKKAGRPSERSGELREQIRRQQGHQCLSEAALHGGAPQTSGLTESQEEAEYEAAVGEATQGVQDAVTEINEKLEEIRYELAELEEPPEVGQSAGGRFAAKYRSTNLVILWSNQSCHSVLGDFGV